MSESKYVTSSVGGPAQTPESANALPRAFNQVSAFQYVTVPLAPTYRAIVQVFYDAKQRYSIDLRPRDVLRFIQEAGFQVDVSSVDDLDGKLGQLVDWGNLTRSHDSDAVTTIHDFYRRRYVYHLTAVGESAHRAVLEVEATVGKSGSLQATMLGKIRDSLRDLAAESAKADADPEQILLRLHDLHGAFETLTQEANRFIGDLNRHTGTEQIDEQRFALRKRAVLAYISRFVEELRQLSHEITAGILAVENSGVDAMLVVASRSRDLPPDLDERDGRVLWIEREKDRWRGLAAWFVGDREDSTPTVDRLAQVAVSAVVSLTRTLGRINERRGQTVDRAADFRQLALWFTECESDEDAHALWQAAFGLYSSRHFHLEEADAELTGPRTSWWDAEPADIPVAMRTRRGASRAGRAAAVPDYSDARRWIAQSSKREREQLEAAVERFADRGELRLSHIAELDEKEFALLLSLLDEVLTSPRKPSGVQAVTSSDGRLHVSLARSAAGDDAIVELRTPRGILRCQDYRIEVRRVATTAEMESEATG